MSFRKLQHRPCRIAVLAEVRLHDADCLSGLLDVPAADTLPFFAMQAGHERLERFQRTGRMTFNLSEAFANGRVPLFVSHA